LNLHYALFVGGFVSLLIFCAVTLIQKLFPKFTQEDRWTIGREVLLFLIVMLWIIIGIFLCIFFIYGADQSIWKLFVKTAFVSLSISFFPIVILVLFEQYRQQKIQFTYAQQLTQLLKAENEALQEEASTNDQVQLKAENGKVELQLRASEIVCLQSDGNYVEVFYELDQIVQKTLIRNRLKSLEEILPKTTFFRCHNRFVINGNYIVHIEGNARNLELTLRGIEAKVPVSRSKAKAISEFITLL
jgi:uncharacterized protein YxjI